MYKGFQLSWLKAFFMPPLDRFSKQAEHYKKFRPVYPPSLYTEIYRHVRSFGLAWDCGTGNGQVAQVLSQKFSQVYASDISENQIYHASEASNIRYIVEQAESTSLEDKSVDLICVAQAIHWFDHKKFWEVCSRVLQPDGVLAVWGYGLLRINKNADQITDQFYQKAIGPFWDKQRMHIDEGYRRIDMPDRKRFQYNNHVIKVNWSIDNLMGYFASWSAVQNFIDKTGKDPLEALRVQFDSLNLDDSFEVTFPIFLKIFK